MTRLYMRFMKARTKIVRSSFGMLNDEKSVVCVGEISVSVTGTEGVSRGDEPETEWKHVKCKRRRVMGIRRIGVIVFNI